MSTFVAEPTLILPKWDKPDASKRFKLSYCICRLRSIIFSNFFFRRQRKRKWKFQSLQEMFEKNKNIITFAFVIETIIESWLLIEKYIIKYFNFKWLGHKMDLVTMARKGNAKHVTRRGNRKAELWLCRQTLLRRYTSFALLNCTLRKKI